VLTEFLKRTVRLAEAWGTRRRATVTFRGMGLELVASRWWDDARQDSFDEDILPYFDALPRDTRPGNVLDLGAASGMFSLGACLAWPTARVFAFEPSPRQRILLKRNLRRNGMRGRVEIHPVATWNRATQLSFRSHGGAGTLLASSCLPNTVRFEEMVPTVSLDEWTEARGVTGLDLIKMDIEGAELETLEGGRATLQRFHPQLLIQAYHLRDGRPTHDRCGRLLADLGYTWRDALPGKLLIHAFYRA
jgi:FkbM family methyltransferase